MGSSPHDPTLWKQSVCVWGGVACLCYAQLGPDVPPPPPADQLPDQALSKRSLLERVTSRSPVTKEMPNLQARGSRLRRCLWIWGCRPLCSGSATSSGFWAGPSQAKASGADFPGQCQRHEVLSPQADGSGDNDPGNRPGVASSVSVGLSEQAGQRGGRAGSEADAWAPSV